MPATHWVLQHVEAVCRDCGWVKRSAGPDAVEAAKLATAARKHSRWHPSHTVTVRRVQEQRWVAGQGTAHLAAEAERGYDPDELIERRGRREPPSDLRSLG